MSLSLQNYSVAAPLVVFRVAEGVRSVAANAASLMFSVVPWAIVTETESFAVDR